MQNRCFTRQVHFLAMIFLVVACLTMNWANILTFNFTVICINPKVEENGENSNISLAESTKIGSGADQQWNLIPMTPFHYKFEAGEQSKAMTVVAIGALLANFPVIILINWYGPRYVFSLIGLLGAVVTAAVPYALSKGFYWFLATRLLQGIAFAGDMATFGHFLTHWTNHRRYAFLTATLALYVQLAPFFTYPISGLLCNTSVGWPSVYYAHSLVSILFFVAFALFYRNNLSEKFDKTPAEKQKNGGTIFPEDTRRFEAQKEKRKAQKDIPFKEIAKSGAVWAIFISAVGDFTAVNLLYQFTPTYLYRVQDMAVMETGLMATIPPLVQALVKELSGLINDRIPRALMGETCKTKVFNSISLLSVAGFIALLAFVPRGHGYIALALITAGEALLGFIVGGFYKSGPVISGIYAPFIMGQVSTALTLTMLFVPMLVNWLTPDNTSEQWATAFWLVACIVVACNTFYLFFAKGEPEPWSNTAEKQKMYGQLSPNTVNANGNALVGEKSDEQKFH